MFPEPNKRPVSSLKCCFMLGLKFYAPALLSCKRKAKVKKSDLILNEFHKRHQVRAPYLKCPHGGVCDYNMVKVSWTHLFPFKSSSAETFSWHHRGAEDPPPLFVHSGSDQSRGCHHLPSKIFTQIKHSPRILSHPHRVAWGRHHKPYRCVLIRHLGHLLSGLSNRLMAREWS